MARPPKKDRFSYCRGGVAAMAAEAGYVGHTPAQGIARRRMKHLGHVLRHLEELGHQVTVEKY